MRIGIGHATPDPAAGRLDAAARALADALLGAAGLGDSAMSAHGEGTEGGEGTALDVLSGAVRAVEGQNYQVVNVDLTVRNGNAGGRRADGADSPGEIRRELADHLHVSPGHVSVEPGTTGISPDAAGRGRTVTAVALLDRIAPMDQVHSTLRAGG